MGKILLFNRNPASDNKELLTGEGKLVNCEYVPVSRCGVVNYGCKTAPYFPVSIRNKVELAGDSTAPLPGSLTESGAMTSQLIFISLILIIYGILLTLCNDAGSNEL